MRKRISYVTLVLLACLIVMAGCSKGQPPDSQQETPGAQPGGPAKPSTLILATTTSTADTGLLDVLNAEFEKEHPEYLVKAIAVGTGEALKMGERKEADIVLVHARKSEDEFVNSGYGFDRRDVMYNDFVLVGPPADPAGVNGLGPDGALAKIASEEAIFVSRADDSGTHKKELSLWSLAGIEPKGDWYLETGQGMGATLQVANEKQGYTMTDRGTFLATSGLSLEVMVEKHEAMLNPYGIIQVTDAKNPEGAEAYADFITSPQGQAIIAEFGKEKYGQPLFFPDAD